MNKPSAAPLPDRRATCRYCRSEVVLGKHGWRLPVNSAEGYACADAPLGYHGIDKSAEGTS